MAQSRNEVGWTIFAWVTVVVILSLAAVGALAMGDWLVPR